MRVQKPTLRRWLSLFVALLPLWLCACGGYEDKRIRELMHEKGFGTRADGNATLETYVAGGDAVEFTLSPVAWQQPDAEKLFLLTRPQAVGIDGTILIPYVGPVQVLGKTEAELAQLVKSLLRPIFPFEVDVQARVRNLGKVYYAFGETQKRGVIGLDKADLTLLEAVARIGWTDLANIGRVYLIKPDAENPLVLVVNLREMVHTGLTATNFRVKENDIIYIPPTFLGMVARIIERLLSPVALAVQTVLGVARIRWAYEVASGEVDATTLRF